MTPKHKFTNWTGIRSTGFQRATIKPSESHATCSECGVHAKRDGLKGSKIKYWTVTTTEQNKSATWSTKVPPCQP